MLSIDQVCSALHQQHATFAPQLVALLKPQVLVAKEALAKETAEAKSARLIRHRHAFRFLCELYLVGLHGDLPAILLGLRALLDDADPPSTLANVTSWVRTLGEEFTGALAASPGRKVCILEWRLGVPCCCFV